MAADVAPVQFSRTAKRRTRRPGPEVAGHSDATSRGPADAGLSTLNSMLDPCDHGPPPSPSRGEDVRSAAIQPGSVDMLGPICWASPGPVPMLRPEVPATAGPSRDGPMIG